MVSFLFHVSLCRSLYLLSLSLSLCRSFCVSDSISQSISVSVYCLCQCLCRSFYLSLSLSLCRSSCLLTLLLSLSLCRSFCLFTVTQSFSVSVFLSDSVTQSISVTECPSVPLSFVSCLPSWNIFHGYLLVNLTFANEFYKPLIYKVASVKIYFCGLRVC